MLESEIEKTVCNYAKSKGWLVFKFVSPSNRGVPDRIFMRAGKMFFIEFKATGKCSTKLQKKKAKDIQKQLFGVYVVDDIGIGKKIIDLKSK